MKIIFRDKKTKQYCSLEFGTDLFVSADGSVYYMYEDEDSEGTLQTYAYDVSKEVEAVLIAEDGAEQVLTTTPPTPEEKACNDFGDVPMDI